MGRATSLLKQASEMNRTNVTFLVMMVCFCVSFAPAYGQPFAQPVVVVGDTVNMFRIVRPIDDLQVEIDVQQMVIVEWRAGGEPVVGAEVKFDATLGALSETFALTNESGLASVFIRSNLDGTATITATAESVNPSDVTIRFTAADALDNSYFSGGMEIPLQTFNDRIGFQSTTGTSEARVLEIAAEEELTLLRASYRGIYEFELTDRYSRDTLNILARGLERDYSDDIRLAGLVVKAETSLSNLFLTDRIIVGLKRGTSFAGLESMEKLLPIGRFVAVSGCSSIFVTKVNAASQSQILNIVERIRNDPVAPVEFAHPNFAVTMRRYDAYAQGNVSACVTLTNTNGEELDPRFCQQWHHNNRAINGGILDADIDTVEAWKTTTGGNSNPLIAVIDSGFGIDHRDLFGNLWQHASDGTRGRDFDDHNHSSLLDDPNYPKPHGTAVAGIVGAIAQNTVGGRGVCPECKLLLIRHGGDNISATESFCFAISESSKAISNSWGAGGVFDSTKHAIEEAVFDNNIPVLFAMASTTDEDLCDGTIDLPSLDHVIGVSSVTHQDDRTASGFGNCADVLAPSRKQSYHGIETAGVYSKFGGGVEYGPFSNFGGTSAATPMVAGTIGLIVDVNPGLSWLQTQRVLQDTADKVDPGPDQSNPATAYYNSETGFSDPPDTTATHAYGRINAQEAVSLVAPFDPAETDLAKRGHGGKDLVLRDHALDWGNTEQSSDKLFTPTNPRVSTPVNKSVDIKIDVDPFQNSPATPAGYLALEHELPEAAKPIRVYVRVRNRGPERVTSAKLKLHWTHKQPLPSLQADFWTKFPADTNMPVSPQSWVPLPFADLSSINYSGESIAGCPERQVPICGSNDPTDPAGAPPQDLASITIFDLPAMDIDKPSGDRLSLLAIVHSDEDPVVAKLPVSQPNNFFDPLTAVIWDNNISLWADTEPACDLLIIKILIVVLIIAVLVIIIVTIRFWPRRRIVVVITITVVIAILIFIYIRIPACVIQVIDQFSMT